MAQIASAKFGAVTLEGRKTALINAGARLKWADIAKRELPATNVLFPVYSIALPRQMSVLARSCVRYKLTGQG